MSFNCMLWPTYSWLYFASQSNQVIWTTQIQSLESIYFNQFTWLNWILFKIEIDYICIPILFFTKLNNNFGLTSGLISLTARGLKCRVGLTCYPLSVLIVYLHELIGKNSYFSKFTIIIRNPRDQIRSLNPIERYKRVNLGISGDEGVGLGVKHNFGTSSAGYRTFYRSYDRLGVYSLQSSKLLDHDLTPETF